MRQKNVLITGPPGVGKTTLVKKLFGALRRYHPVGFYTAEKREKGVREGFELVSPGRGRAVFSHTSIKGPLRVGKYGVDVQGFEAFLDTMDLHPRAARLVIIDEIGRMECLSPRFTGLIKELLDSSTPLIATIAARGGKGGRGAGPIDEIKGRDDVRLFEVTRDNRDGLPGDIIGYVNGLLASV